MNNNDCINVCLATDKNYVQYAGITISSVLKNAAPEDNLAFYILCDGLDDDDRRQLKSVAAQRGCSIKFIVPDLDKISRRKLPEHISKAALFILQLPDLLPEIKKVIYLDCDVIVMSSLGELWDTELDGNIIGGVADYFRSLSEHQKKISCEDIVYINSGVFIFDLDSARKGNITDKFMETNIKIKDITIFADQDVINVTLGKSLHVLPLKWNLATGYFRGEYDLQYYSNEEIAEAVKSPGAIHFTGKTKPWHWRRSRNPFWFEYYKAAKSTPWSEKYYKGLIKKVFFPYKRRKSPATRMFFEQ